MTALRVFGSGSFRVSTRARCPLLPLGGSARDVVVKCAAASVAEVKSPLMVRMMLEPMETKKDVAAALSTSGRVISWRRAVSRHVLLRTRPWDKVCDQRGGRGVREQRRHRHGARGFEVGTGVGKCRTRHIGSGTGAGTGTGPSTGPGTGKPTGKPECRERRCTKPLGRSLLCIYSCRPRGTLRPRASPARAAPSVYLPIKVT